MSTYPKWLREAASKGGKKSRRKLSKKEARRISLVRWAAGAGRGAEKARGTKKGKAPNAKLRVGDSVSVLTRRGWIPANVDWIRGDRCRLVSADLKLDMTARCDLVKELRDLQRMELGAAAPGEKAPERWNSATAGRKTFKSTNRVARRFAGVTG